MDRGTKYARVIGLGGGGWLRQPAGGSAKAARGSVPRESGLQYPPPPPAFLRSKSFSYEGNRPLLASLTAGALWTFLVCFFTCLLSFVAALAGEIAATAIIGVAKIASAKSRTVNFVMRSSSSLARDQYQARMSDTASDRTFPGGRINVCRL